MGCWSCACISAALHFSVRRSHPQAGHTHPPFPLAPTSPAPQASTPAPAPLDLADFAERLAELAAKAAVVPEGWLYAVPCGPAARHQGAWAPQPYELPDMAERLAELKQRLARRQAVAAFADSLAYAQPGLGRAQRKVRPAGAAGWLLARLDGCWGAAGAVGGTSCMCCFCGLGKARHQRQSGTA